MSYNANIPQATDHKSQSQSDILGNFTALNTYVAVDHIALNLADEGKHKKATFPAAVAPGAVGATEVGLYAKNTAAPFAVAPELWINKTATQIPFTAAIKAASGCTYLPSGIIIQWGTALLSNAGVIVGFAMTFPNACLNVQLTNNSNSGSNQFLMADTLLPASFTGWATTRSGGAVANVPVFYLAIGY